MAPSDLKLPQEILDLIVNELGGNDLKTLAACSTVSTSLQTSCQKKLFHTITIDLSPAEEARNIKLGQTLEGNMRLLAFIKSLNVLIPAIETATTTILTQPLSKLGDFSMSITSAKYPSPANWGFIPEGPRRSLIHLIWSAQTLILDRIYTFDSFILPNCSRLRELHIPRIYTQLPPSKYSPPEPPAEIGYLESLVIPYSDPCLTAVETLERPSSSLSLSRLRSFRNSTFGDSSVSMTQRVIENAAAFLERFETQAHTEHSDTLYLDLGSLKKLKPLHLHVAGGRDSTAFNWTTNVLKTISPSNQIVEIAFLVNGVFRSEIEKWQEIDSLLTRAGHMQHLRRVLILIGAYFDQTHIALLRQIMGKLDSSGYLYIKGSLHNEPEPRPRFVIYNV